MTRSLSRSSLDEIGTLCIDGAPLTALDVAHVEAAEQARREALRSSLYAVATASRDAEDCRMIFDMLGIDLEVVRALRHSKQQPPAVPPARTGVRCRSGTAR